MKGSSARVISSSYKDAVTLPSEDSASDLANEAASDAALSRRAFVTASRSKVMVGL